MYASSVASKCSNDRLGTNEPFNCFALRSRKTRHHLCQSRREDPHGRRQVLVISPPTSSSASAVRWPEAVLRGTKSISLLLSFCESLDVLFETLTRSTSVLGKNIQCDTVSSLFSKVRSSSKMIYLIVNLIKIKIAHIMYS